MANIAVAEACPIDIDVFSKSDYFKKFAHFVLMYQFCTAAVAWIYSTESGLPIVPADR